LLAVNAFAPREVDHASVGDAAGHEEGTMGYKDILVYLDPTPASRIRLDVAMQIAVADGAYVTGVDASTDEAFLGDWRDSATQVETAFHAALEANEVAGEFHVAGPRGKLGLEELVVPADLMIAPSPSPESRRLIHPDLPDGAIKRAGAPVLVLPTDWPGGAWGKTIVIAWNGDREARRAVADALPFLKRAQRVIIFVFSSAPSDLRGAADRLVAHLSRHGVTAEVSDWTNTGDVTAVEALFASLDTQTADLLVAGAFGHSRMFERLFGSVSLDLLRQPVLPVLMSH
jgi:nucleotide-binding universal stress UspA family protein